MSTVPFPQAAPRVLLFGATGTIGRATARALVRRGIAPVCIVRAGSDPARLPPEALRRVADVGDPASLAEQAIRGERFDAAISCLASRTGVPRDAWAIDHRANGHALAAAKAAGVPQFVLLSAICVQKPVLAFQQAKLAFEAELMASGIDWTIVRPTAFFKSLSGQVARVQAGKPFLIFGDGRGTACKPIHDDDLGDYLADCLTLPKRRNRILAVGGPGPAITPRDQGELIFALIGREPQFRSVPLGLLDAIASALGVAGRISRRAADKAELARIGRYYAGESMLVLDPATGRYDADATPEWGTRTLADHYRALIAGERADDRGDHAVF